MYKKGTVQPLSSPFSKLYQIQLRPQFIQLNAVKQGVTEEKGVAKLQPQKIQTKVLTVQQKRIYIPSFPLPLNYAQFSL